MKSEKYNTYFDIDGIIIVLTYENFKRKLDEMNNFDSNININNNKKKIFNKNKILLNNVYYDFSKCCQIYLEEKVTIFGRIDIYLVLLTSISDLTIFYNKILNIERRYINSFSKNELRFESVNIPIKKFFEKLSELKSEFDIDCIVYGEKFGSKLFFQNKLQFMEIVNEKFTIYDFKLYEMEVFELDICKNIKKLCPSNKAYLTNMYLKLGKKSGKNFLEKFASKPVYNYNIMNDTKHNDYHANNTKIKFTSNRIIITKINLYNPIINNMCNKFTQKKEIYNLKFVHEILYKSNDIKYNSSYKHVNKYLKNNIYELGNNIKSFICHNNFYRIEFRFSINNKERGYKPINWFDIDLFFSIYKFFKYKNKYVSYTISKVENLKIRLYRNLKFLRKYLLISEANYIIVSKKIFLNIIFFEFFLRGGKKLHFIPSNDTNKIIIDRNIPLRQIMQKFINLFENYNFPLKMVENYIVYSNIKFEIKNEFIQILKMFEIINNRNYKLKIFELFINEMAKYYDLETTHFYDLNEQINNVEATMNLTEFINLYFLKILKNNKTRLNHYFYNKLLFAIRILKFRYNINELEFNSVFHKKSIRKFYIVKNVNEENKFAFCKVVLYDIPTKFDFKIQIMRTLRNIFIEENVLRKRGDKFIFTEAVKRIYCYFRDERGYSNNEYYECGLTPLWIIFSIKTRLQNIKSSTRKLNINWEESSIPDILINGKEKIIKFIKNNMIFKKKIEIEENKEFCELIKFLIDLEDNEYNLTKEDFNYYYTHLLNLKFVTRTIVNYNNADNITLNALLNTNYKLIIKSRLVLFINTIKLNMNESVQIKFETIIKFILTELQFINDLSVENITEYVKHILKCEPFIHILQTEIEDELYNFVA